MFVFLYFEPLKVHDTALKAVHSGEEHNSPLNNGILQAVYNQVNTNAHTFQNK